MSFPVDESRYGIYDLSGSVFEWVSDWYAEGKTRMFMGGAWGYGAVETFRITRHHGKEPDSTSVSHSFRLIAVKMKAR